MFSIIADAAAATSLERIAEALEALAAADPVALGDLQAQQTMAAWARRMGWIVGAQTLLTGLTVLLLVLTWKETQKSTKAIVAQAAAVLVWVDWQRLLAVEEGESLLFEFSATVLNGGLSFATDVRAEVSIQATIEDKAVAFETIEVTIDEAIAPQAKSAVKATLRWPNGKRFLGAIKAQQGVFRPLVQLSYETALGKATAERRYVSNRVDDMPGELSILISADRI